VRMLDLYCGEGLSAWGYWLSGRFSEVVGIDTNYDLKRSYAFDFICGDALSLDYDFLMDFDFIHASPPCQGYSKMTPDQSKHPRLIKPTHLMLEAAGKPYVIENVEGSGQELRPNLRLYGHDFGLNMHRPRYFHMSSSQHINVIPGANVSTRQLINEMPGDNEMSSSSSSNVIHGGEYMSRDALIRVFGLDCIPLARRRSLTREGIEQGIPPAMTKAIAEAMFPNYRAMIG